MTKDRTTLQREADRIDCELFRLLGRVEELYDAHKNYRQPRRQLSDALRGLRSARGGVRALMHDQDREQTV